MGDWNLVSLTLGTFLILLPFLGAIFLLVFAKWKADTTGFLVWIVMFVFAVTIFKTDLLVTFLASVAGFIASYPIALMVCTSIFMITYMQKTGALQRIIVGFKTLGGEGKQAFQIMFLNIGLGSFLVSIGATPVTMLPPIMAAIGYSPLVAVALPAIGYDPLCTFALLAIPAVIFQDVMSGLFNLTPLFPTLAESGFIFSVFMPVVTTGIALGMLYIAGGRKLLFKKESLLFAFVGGISAGGTALLINTLAKLLNADGLVPLTGLFAGLVTCGSMIVLAKLLRYKIFDRDNLTTEDLEIEKSMPLWKAFMPWTILVILCALTNFIPPVYNFLFHTLAMKITIGGAKPIALRVFWNAWFWVIVATVLSMPFLGFKGKAKETFTTWARRSIRPVFAAAIFFSVAYVMNWSGAIGTIGSDNLWEINAKNNMIKIISDASALVFGDFYPVIVPFVGLLGGFVSGSETSAIAMFTGFQYNTGVSLGLSNTGIVVLGAANGIGGGLASVLSPAKIQNAAAVIDKSGIEGEVIKKTAPIALLMVVSVAAITLCWANNYSIALWFATFGIVIGTIFLLGLVFYVYRMIKRKQKELNEEEGETTSIQKKQTTLPSQEQQSKETEKNISNQQLEEKNDF
ncbi:MAG: L-lactate permease [Candidatus Heimdallarchaeota archaeon]|nr:L-lactate permease [Candidatus Heimdallarchaeota archaeon]